MLTTWNAFPLLEQLLDDVMTGAGGTALGTSSAERAFAPAIDVRVNESEILVTADVPGIRREDLEVTLEDGVLSISGRRQYEGNVNDKVSIGRSYGAFERSFTLPDTADSDQFSADLSDGVLTVRISQKPRPKARKVSIGAGQKTPSPSGPQEPAKPGS